MTLLGCAANGWELEELLSQEFQKNGCSQNLKLTLRLVCPCLFDCFWNTHAMA